MILLEFHVEMYVLVLYNGRCTCSWDVHFSIGAVLPLIVALHYFASTLSVIIVQSSGENRAEVVIEFQLLMRSSITTTVPYCKDHTWKSPRSHR